MSRGLVGWRYAAFVASLVGAIGLTCYPIIIMPLQDPEPWKKRNQENREKAGLDQTKIQPGNMNVWTDPFQRKKD